MLSSHSTRKSNITLVYRSLGEFAELEILSVQGMYVQHADMFCLKSLFFTKNLAPGYFSSVGPRERSRQSEGPLRFVREALTP